MPSSTPVPAPAPRARHGWRRPWLARAPYLAWLLLACEALLQVAARLSPGVDLLLANRYGASPYLEDARLGRRPNPRYGDHDAWGFRNARVPAQARIVALGDSQTYGVSARREEAWPQQLERLAGEPVYNMAYGGWGPPHYLLLLPKALELRPRLVLLSLYTGNDLWDALEMAYLRRGVPELEALATRGPAFVARVRNARAELERAGAQAARLMTPGFTRAEAPGLAARDRGPVARVLAGLRDHSKLWGAARALRTALGLRSARADDPRRAPAGEAHWRELSAYAETSPHVAVCEQHGVRTALDVGYRVRAFDEELWPEGLRLCLESLAIAHRRLAEKGVAGRVVLIPTKEYVFYSGCPEPVRARGAYRALHARETAAREQAIAFLKDHRIVYVDAAPALKAALAGGSAIYPLSTDSHPNAAGYAVIAQAVAAALRGDPE